MKKVLLHARAWLLILASATLAAGQTDAREMIRRAAAADERNWKAARNYTFSEREKLRYLDSQGGVKSQEVRLTDVMLLDGSPYSRLVARDDRPLSPAEDRKEQEKLTRNLAERRDQTASQRGQRLADYASRPEWQREAWRELPDAFDFRLAGEEVWDGHALYVIEATPHQGYQPLSRTAKIFAHLRCRLWVDKQDYHLVKGDVEVVDTISVGLFLVRVARGSHAAFEQTRVNDEVWLPSHLRASVSARLGLLKVLRVEQELSYSKCRDSRADSPVISQMSAR
ncbi:MAG TPA: hypothetical protein VN893_08795 [Bryobacteraceae bacterium]|nr:hypothetical protein [Bryobacteraceae bacterium]